MLCLQNNNNYIVTMILLLLLCMFFWFLISSQGIWDSFWGHTWAIPVQEEQVA